MCWNVQTYVPHQEAPVAAVAQECDFVMELKIPRFVVETVFPNLAFNSSAISA